MRLRTLPLCVVALALVAGAARPADKDPGADDERTLKQAGVATDDAGLLQFFRKQSPNEDEIRALIKKLDDDDFDVRVQAAKDLVLLGSVAEPFLREAVKTGSAEVKRSAEECLQKIGGAGPSAAVMSAAARLLARRKPAGSAEVLLAYAPRMTGEAGADDVLAALAAVAVRDGKPEPVLVKALEDKSPGRRAAAAVALARGGARDALPAVRKLLQDADTSVRLRTALALVALKESEAVGALIDLLAVLPRAQHGPIDDVLYRLAEEKAPDGLKADDEAARKKYRDAWADWWKKSADTTDLAKLTEAGTFLGYTMVVMLDAGRVLEMDKDGKTRWQVEGLEFPLDAQRLPGDRVLVAEHKGNRVTERDRKGTVLWEKRVDGPIMAQRLPNGHTFIATRMQLLEVDRAGKEVFSQARGPQDDLLMRARKLANGDIALVVATAGALPAGAGVEFVRLDASGKQVSRFAVGMMTSGGRVEVLPNGHVLAPLRETNKVVEYDAAGKVVWEAEFPQPVAAVRLANGHTVVTSYQDKRAVELDAAGKQVWEYKANERVTRAWRR
jgi:outer membrane protein assembly factor BamB